MNSDERIKNWKLHDSMRGIFGFELYKHMAKNEKIVLITADLGWGLFDHHREDFSERFFNVGASEQNMMNMAVGFSLSDKIPVIYSITPFLLYRPFETLRTYINHERLNVKLIGSGRDKDYVHDGMSHWSEDAKSIMKLFPHIQSAWPEDKKDIPDILTNMLKQNKPYFLSLKR